VKASRATPPALNHYRSDPGDAYYATSRPWQRTDYFTSAVGAHSVVITPGVLTIAARATNVTVGHPLTSWWW